MICPINVDCLFVIRVRSLCEFVSLNESSLCFFICQCHSHSSFIKPHLCRLELISDWFNDYPWITTAQLYWLHIKSVSLYRAAGSLSKSSFKTHTSSLSVPRRSPKMLKLRYLAIPLDLQKRTNFVAKWLLRALKNKTHKLHSSSIRRGLQKNACDPLVHDSPRPSKTHKLRWSMILRDLKKNNNNNKAQISLLNILQRSPKRHKLRHSDNPYCYMKMHKLRCSIIQRSPKIHNASFKQASVIYGNAQTSLLKRSPDISKNAQTSLLKRSQKISKNAQTLLLKRSQEISKIAQYSMLVAQWSRRCSMIPKILH